jgi:hypothetical protein
MRTKAPSKKKLIGLNVSLKDLCPEKEPKPVFVNPNEFLGGDNWVHRSSSMLCRTCMYYAPKLGLRNLGRCRRHAPTMSGWPVMFSTDWCGDHKIDENKL